MSFGEIVGIKGITTGLASVAFEILLLALAVRSNTRTRDFARALAVRGWPTSGPPPPVPRFLAIAAAIPPLLTVAQMVYTVQRSRTMMLEGLGSNPVHAVGLAPLGLRQELGAILGGMLGLAPLLIIGSVVAGLALSARVRRTGLAWANDLAGRDNEAARAWAAHPGLGAPTLVAVILGFVVLSFGPLIAGAVWATWLQLQAFDAMTQADPAAKAAVYEQAQRVAGMLLERAYRVAIVGAACAAIGAVILVRLTSAARARAKRLGRPAPEPTASTVKALAGIALSVVAIVLFAVARPMKRENTTPWPPGSVNDQLPVETPPMDGPDRLELGPLVAVTTTELVFNGERVDAGGLGSRLRAYRANFPLLHPGEAPPRELLLACAPQVGNRRMLDAIEIAHLSGYDAVRFLFETAQQILRPALGTMTLRNVTAARVSIDADDAMVPDGTEPVRLDDSETCSKLAERVVKLRRTGRPVLLLLPAAPGDRHQPLQE